MPLEGRRIDALHQARHRTWQGGALLLRRNTTAAVMSVLLVGYISIITPTAGASHVLSLQPVRHPNSIQIENARPGTGAWRLTSPARAHEIEGFASRTSIDRGEPITFYISTIAPQYDIEIYRMGWYDGTGGRFMAGIHALRGFVQPQPVVSRRAIECFWMARYTLTVPPTWVSGIYLAKLTAETGQQSYIVFVVRDDSGTNAFLVKQAVTTYESYNNWGGFSLYGATGDNEFNDKSRSYFVSYDRPYSDGHGAGFLFSWDIAFVRWAEAQGYDLSYATDIDLHERPGILMRHHALISLGHDEYWSAQMRDAVEHARDQGVNLAFFSADVSYWNIRLEPSPLGADRIQVCYKRALDDPLHLSGSASQVTDEWRKIGRPENGMVGVMFGGIVRHSYPMIMTHTSDPLFAGTGFHDGSVVAGIVGYEYDRAYYDTAQPAALNILSHAPLTDIYGHHDDSNMAYYVAPSGAFVFAAGTIEWAWALDPFDEHAATDPGMQRLTANIMDRLTIDRRPVPNAALSIAPSDTATAVDLPSITTPSISLTVPLTSLDVTIDTTPVPGRLEAHSVVDNSAWSVHLIRGTVCFEGLHRCSQGSLHQRAAVGIVGIVTGRHVIQVRTLSVRPMTVIGTADWHSAATGALALHTRHNQHYLAFMDPLAERDRTVGSLDVKRGTPVALLGFPLSHQRLEVVSLFPKPSEVTGRIVALHGMQARLLDDEHHVHRVNITGTTEFSEHQARTDVSHLIVGESVVIDGLVDIDGTLFAQSVALGPIAVVGTFVRQIGHGYSLLMQVHGSYYEAYLSRDTMLYADLSVVDSQHLPTVGTSITVLGYFSPPRALLAMSVRWGRK